MYSINKSEVFRYLGNTGQDVPKDIDTLSDRLIEKALRLLNPKYTYRISDLEFSETGIELKDTNLTLTGRDISEHLKGAKKCITLACTLGVAFETELSRLQAKSVTEALIFDAVGTAFTEAVADKSEEELLLPFKREGYFSKFRFSPGYGDLPITLQKDIIATLDATKRIGLTVTHTNILIPRKSVTAFIGIFDTPQKKPHSKCEICSARSMCSMRKDGKACD